MVRGVKAFIVGGVVLLAAGSSWADDGKGELPTKKPPTETKVTGGSEPVLPPDPQPAVSPKVGVGVKPLRVGQRGPDGQPITEPPTNEKEQPKSEEESSLTDLKIDKSETSPPGFTIGDPNEPDAQLHLEHLRSAFQSAEVSFELPESFTTEESEVVAVNVDLALKSLGQEADAVTDHWKADLVVTDVNTGRQARTSALSHVLKDGKNRIEFTVQPPRDPTTVEFSLSFLRTGIAVGDVELRPSIRVVHDAKETREVLDPWWLSLSALQVGQTALFVLFLFIVGRAPLVDLGAWVVRIVRRWRGTSTKEKQGGQGSSSADESVGEEAGEGKLSELPFSDRALHRLDQDLLGRAELAKSISAFLTNPKTAPPITVAVSGAWGSGKSSLMGMIHHDLKLSGARPVWFNAWHHTTEDQMLGALLETLRVEAVPPVWSLNGQLFRWKLFWKRAFKRPLEWLFLFVVLGFWAYHGFPQPGHRESFTLLQDLAQPSSPFLASLVAALVLLARFGTAFGYRPKELFRKVAAMTNSTNAQPDPGLRYKVSKDLDDITAALENRPIVLFVDDLDRCPADRILKVLQQINYLTSMPKRFHVVLGVALENVLISIAGEFEDFARQKFPKESGESDEVYERRIGRMQVAHAREYLEKMVNIEVRVPDADHEAIAKMAIDSTPQTDSDPRESDYVRQKRIDRWAIPVATVMLTLALVVPEVVHIRGIKQLWEGNNVGLHHHPIAEAPSQVRVYSLKPPGTEQRGVPRWQPPAAKKVLKKPAEKTAATENSPASEPEEPGEAGALGTSPEESSRLGRVVVENLRTILTAVILVITAIVLWIVIRRAGSPPVREDSEEFEQALERWTACIRLNNPTPRNYKRVVNQLRMAAMRVRIQDEHQKKPLADRSERLVVLAALRELSHRNDGLLQLLAEFASDKKKLAIGSFLDLLFNALDGDPVPEDARERVEFAMEQDPDPAEENPEHPKALVFKEACLAHLAEGRPLPAPGELRRYSELNSGILLN